MTGFISKLVIDPILFNDMRLCIGAILKATYFPTERKFWSYVRHVLLLLSFNDVQIVLMHI